MVSSLRLTFYWRGVHKHAYGVLGRGQHCGRPDSGFALQSDDYLRMGERLAAVGLPTVLVFEGGYAVDAVGVNVVNVLQAFA